MSNITHIEGLPKSTDMLRHVHCPFYVCFAKAPKLMYSSKEITWRHGVNKTCLKENLSGMANVPLDTAFIFFHKDPSSSSPLVKMINSLSETEVVKVMTSHLKFGLPSEIAGLLPIRHNLSGRLLLRKMHTK